MTIEGHFLNYRDLNGKKNTNSLSYLSSGRALDKHHLRFLDVARWLLLLLKREKGILVRGEGGGGIGDQI